MSTSTELSANWLYIMPGRFQFFYTETDESTSRQLLGVYTMIFLTVVHELQTFLIFSNFDNLFKIFQTQRNLITRSQVFINYIGLNSLLQ